MAEPRNSLSARPFRDETIIGGPFQRI
jgi:hypothetical protein